MAEYVYETDILDIDTQVIVQQCYCSCATKGAKGLAADIKKRFPHADFYSARKKDSKPGTIEMKGGKGIGRFVCAFYAQKFPGGPGKDGDSTKEREHYFGKCLTSLAKVKNIREVAFPYKIGCGLASGEWDNYSAMIEEFARDNDHIRVLVINWDPEPKNPPEEISEDDTAFIKWVCAEIEKDHNILDKFPELSDYFRSKYYDYLHNVSEDDAIAEKSQDEEDENISWNTTTLEEYTENHKPEGWEDFFTQQLDPDCGSIREISKYLFGELQKGEIYPELSNVYKVFETNPEDIRVIIIAQDPYINPGEATGIAFSVPEDVNIPPSLRNIYKELKDDGFDVTDSQSGDLTKWREQGVFLINSALTVRAHESGSHSKKWNESFSPQLMRWISDARANNPIVVIMWGNHAQSFSRFFGDEHRKIMGVHPSPLSASRGFFGSKPFSKANKHLAALGYEPIDWSL